MALGSTWSVNCGDIKEITGTISDAASPNTQTRCRTAADCRWSNVHASAASAIAIVDLITIPQKGKLIITKMGAGTLLNSNI